MMLINRALKRPILVSEANGLDAPLPIPCTEGVAIQGIVLRWYNPREPE